MLDETYDERISRFERDLLPGHIVVHQPVFPHGSPSMFRRGVMIVLTSIIDVPMEIPSRRFYALWAHGMQANHVETMYVNVDLDRGSLDL